MINNLLIIFWWKWSPEIVNFAESQRNDFKYVNLLISLLFSWIADENWSQKLLQLIAFLSNFSIYNFGKRTFSCVSEIWKDKSWGNLFGSAFFLGFDKCKSILDIVSKYLSSQVRIWSSSFSESYSFSCNNKCSSSPFILLVLFSIDVFIVFKRIIVSKLLSGRNVSEISLTSFELFSTWRK